MSQMESLHSSAVSWISLAFFQRGLEIINTAAVHLCTGRCLQPLQWRWNSPPGRPGPVKCRNGLFGFLLNVGRVSLKNIPPNKWVPSLSQTPKDFFPKGSRGGASLPIHIGCVYSVPNRQPWASCCSRYPSFSSTHLPGTHPTHRSLPEPIIPFKLFTVMCFCTYCTQVSCRNSRSSYRVRLYLLSCSTV